MTDDALLAWINTGAKIELTGDEAQARRVQNFSARFLAALNPVEDLGPTCELHEAAVASNVFAVHIELCGHGDEEYNKVWRPLPANVRAALKAYISQGSPASTPSKEGKL